MNSILSTIEVLLEEAAKRRALGLAVRSTRRLLARPRYILQNSLAHLGYLRAGADHPQVILIFGLPKSGTTWLESMVSDYSGYQSVYPPSVVDHELLHGETLTLEIEESDVNSLVSGLSVWKAHASASECTLRTIEAFDLKYVVMYRDIRDVALSFVHFVGSRPWHPSHDAYSGLGVHQALGLFAEDRLGEYAEWIRGWRRHRHPIKSLEIRYEDLMADEMAELKRVVTHFGLPIDDIRLRKSINKFSFSSRERSQSTLAAATHFRKGKAGGWREWFTEDLTQKYDHIWGDLKQELGY